MNYLMSGILLVFSVLDLRTKKVPKILFFVAGIILLVMRFMFGNEWDSNSFSGIIVGLFLIFVVIVTRGKMGMGDAILFVILGFQLSLVENGILLLISLTFAAFVGGILWFAKRIGRQEKIPFIPFVFIGYGVMMLCG